MGRKSISAGHFSPSSRRLSGFRFGPFLCRFLTRFFIGPVTLIASSAAHAQSGALDSGDTAWLLTSTALVLMMTLPGLALFYAGIVRSKNVLSVFMQCFSISALVSVLWLVAGYSLSFTDGAGLNAFVGGLSKVFLAGVGRASMEGSSPETVFVMFQLTFAIITPALIVGAFAERMRFSAMLLFMGLWMFVVYFPICHQVWGGGWLSDLGFLDFAGGAVVHITAGVAAIVAALVMGPRSGFQKTAMRPNNLTLTVAGAGMLWVGWFGFNGGSALAAGGDAGMAVLVTHISAATAALTWMAVEWVRGGKPGVLGLVTGMVAGLATITPAAGFVGPVGAFLIGLSAGVVCFFATVFLKHVLHIDDSLDVFPVHGLGGILGLILCAIFMSPFWGGAGYAEGSDMAGQFLVQVIGVLATALWTAVATFILLKLINLFVPLRADRDGELLGLDLSHHGERGYNL